MFNVAIFVMISVMMFLVLGTWILIVPTWTVSIISLSIYVLFVIYFSLSHIERIPARIRFVIRYGVASVLFIGGGFIIVLAILYDAWVSRDLSLIISDAGNEGIGIFFIGLTLIGIGIFVIIQIVGSLQSYTISKQGIQAGAEFISYHDIYAIVVDQRYLWIFRSPRQFNEYDKQKMPDMPDLSQRYRLRQRKNIGYQTLTSVGAAATSPGIHFLKKNTKLTYAFNAGFKKQVRSKNTGVEIYYNPTFSDKH